MKITVYDVDPQNGERAAYVVSVDGVWCGGVYSTAAEAAAAAVAELGDANEDQAAADEPVPYVLTSEHLRTRLARMAYEAYGVYVGWTSYNGSPMPFWEGCGPTGREGWVSAAAAVADEVRKACTDDVSPEQGNNLPGPGKQLAATIGSEEAGDLYIWGGAMSGWTIEEIFETAYLRHRCGTEISVSGDFLANTIMENVIGHTCR